MTSAAGESALTFACGADRLVGILHRPPGPASAGVVIVVGGPQYRIGSHRQFLLLARALAAAGCAVLRFDCRGMGDSDGVFPGFAAIEDDIAAAVEALLQAVPGLERVVLWGLCDAASAISFYAPKDARIAGLVLLNPWVRSEATEARTYLRHYYRQRLFDPEFLRKAARGKFNPFAAGRAFLGTLWRTLGAQDGSQDADGLALPERMAVGCEAFGGPLLLIISGRDLTAKEFEDCAAGSARWQRLWATGRILRQEIPDADHTFSRRAWRDQVAEWTRDWILHRLPETQRGARAAARER